MGETEVDVSVVSLTEEKEKALNVALNKISGDWDKAKLADLLEAMSDADALLTGFDAAEIGDLMREYKPETEIVEDDIPDLPEEPVTQKGDLWMLGRHRLVCGDSTLPEDFTLLMGGVSQIWSLPTRHITWIIRLRQKIP